MHMTSLPTVSAFGREHQFHCHSYLYDCCIFSNCIQEVTFFKVIAPFLISDHNVTYLIIATHMLLQMFGKLKFVAH